MSWSQSTDATARSLARLLATGGGVEEPDLDLALAARTAAVDLAATVCRTTRPGHTPEQNAYRPRPADLDADPVRLLAQLLAAQPRPAGTGTALTEVLDRPRTSTTGQEWGEVARHATIAAHDWATADPRSHPTGDARWSALSKVAAIAEAATLLDDDLATSAATAGRPDTAERLTRAAWSGLAGTARAVQALAARGDLPEVPDVSAPAPRAVLPVRSLDDLAPAGERLRHLVSTAASLAPKDVQLIAGVHARTSAAAAQALLVSSPKPAPPHLAPLVQGLAQHARLLADAVERPRRVEGMEPGDPPSLAQAAEINRYLASARGSGPQAAAGRHADALVAFAQVAPGVTAALAAAARAQVRQGRWLVPPGEHFGKEAGWARYDFIRSTPFTPAPPLVTALVRAADHGRGLADLAARAHQQEVGTAASAAAVAYQGMPGTGELAAALAAHRAAQTRPASPGTAVGYRYPVPTHERGRKGPEL